MATIGNLVTRLSVDGSKFQSGLQKAQNETKSFARSVSEIVAGISLASIGGKAISGIREVTSSIVQLAAEAQTTAVQFKVLTGSAETAAQVMDNITKFAAATPFESMEIAQAAKQLIAFGGSAGTVIAELRMLGELSAGMNIPLNELAEIYGKARIQGRLFMEDINQLQGRGINVTEQLAKQFGNVREAVEKGQVNFEHLHNALINMTSEGGRFSGMMTEMSQTFSGQMSTLMDNIKSFGRELGQVILPLLTSIVSKSNELLQKFQQMPDKMQFLGDLLNASFDVAFETILVKWDETLAAMFDKAVGLLPKIGEMILNPAGIGAKFGANAGADAAARRGEGGATPLEAAQNRLNEVLTRLESQKLPEPAAGLQIEPKADGTKLGDLAGEIFGKAQEIAAGLQTAVEQEIAGITQQVTWWQGTLTNWLGNDKKTESDKQNSGFMAKNSSEAFSTIVNRMMGKTPEQQEIAKNTKATVDGFKNVVAALDKGGASAPVFPEFVTV